MLTLLNYLGVSIIQTESPGLLYGSQNLQDNMKKIAVQVLRQKCFEYNLMQYLWLNQQSSDYSADIFQGHKAKFCSLPGFDCFRLHLCRWSSYHLKILQRAMVGLALNGLAPLNLNLDQFQEMHKCNQFQYERPFAFAKVSFKEALKGFKCTCARNLHTP